MREVQVKMVELLVEFDRICRANDIKYSVEGGTLLGAVKYGGFVPWDDDIDIVMTRENYERFLAASKTQLGKRFFFQNSDTDKYYPLNYSKLRMNDTVYKQQNYENLDIHHGLFLDIFPLDYVDNKTFRRWCSVLGVLTGARTKKLKIRMIQPKWKQFIYSLVGVLPLGCINGTINLIFKTLGKKKKPFVFEMCSPLLINKFQSAERYEQYTELEFEGVRVMAVKDYECFLTERFGDYMNTEPDAETRGPSHAICECKL